MCCSFLSRIIIVPPYFCSKQLWNRTLLSHCSILESLIYLSLHHQFIQLASHAGSNFYTRKKILRNGIHFDDIDSFNLLSFKSDFCLKAISNLDKIASNNMASI